MAIARPLLLLLALCATAATARTLMSSSYCDWGGVDNSKYPWAKPRSERDWYCGNTALFNSEAEGAAGSGQPIQFAIYGDSIMQCLRWEGEFCRGVNEWFDRNWGTKYNAKSWALGSETASTLFWRMLNGDGNIKNAGVKVALVYIGSNNFGQARQDADGQAAAGEELLKQVKDMTKWMMSQDDNVVIYLLSLLPKTGYAGSSISMKVNPATWSAVQKYNAKLEEYAKQEDRVRYIGCTKPFLKGDGESINGDYMIDGLHPNIAGFRKLAECIDPFLKQNLA